MVRKQEIVNLMTPYPRGVNYEVKRVELMYFFRNLPLYSGDGSDKLSL